MKMVPLKGNIPHPTTYKSFSIFFIRHFTFLVTKSSRIWRRKAIECALSHKQMGNILLS